MIPLATITVAVKVAGLLIEAAKAAGLDDDAERWAKQVADFAADQAKDGAEKIYRLIRGTIQPRLDNVFFAAENRAREEAYKANPAIQREEERMRKSAKAGLVVAFVAALSLGAAGCARSPLQSSPEVPGVTPKKYSVVWPADASPYPEDYHTVRGEAGMITTTLVYPEPR